MPTAERIHLRDGRRRRLCGSKGPAVFLTAIEWFARQRVRRCPHCWRRVVEHIATLTA